MSLICSESLGRGVMSAISWSFHDSLELLADSW